MRKLILNVVLAITAICCLSSCGYDNFDKPETYLTGHVEYNGQALQLPGSAGQIQLQAYQSGYQLTSPITIYVDQDGRFSARLFNRHYKIVTKDNNGPWVNARDTVEVDLSGSTEIHVSVTPYFLLSDYTCKFNTNTRTLTIGFAIQRIVSNAQIDYAAVCIGTTSIVDEQNNALKISIPASQLSIGANTFTVPITDEQLAAINKAVKVTARVGLRAVGADRSIYTNIIALK